MQDSKNKLYHFDFPIILASQSPRRKDLLQQIGLDFSVMIADIDESVLTNETADEYLCRVAQAKAEKIAQHYPEHAIIAADTTVCLDQDMFAKPVDFADACRIWQQLSGQQHQVKTCVVVRYGSQQYHQIVSTQIQFKNLTLAEMQAYWATGEPQDKAGAYAIQGYAGAWVAQMKGSYSNVVGLPLFETVQLLQQIQVMSE